MNRRTRIQGLDHHGGAVAENLGRAHHGTRVVAHADDGIATPKVLRTRNPGSSKVVVVCMVLMIAEWVVAP
jgi:hypothetical protein